MSETAVLFKKLDDTKRDIHALDTRLAVVEKTVETTEQRFDSLTQTMAENHAKTTGHLEQIAATVNSLSNDYHQRQGAKNLVTKWAIPILSAITAVIAIFYVA